MRTKLREGETTKWRVYQVGREARLRPGVAPREREGGVDAGRRVRCTDTSPLMNAPGMCEGFYVRRRRRRRRHYRRHLSLPFSLRHQPRIGRHPRRPTSARAHSSPLTSYPDSTPATLLPSPLSSSSSSVLHPSSFTHPSLFLLIPVALRVPPCLAYLLVSRFLSDEWTAGHHPTESRWSPFSRAVLNALHSSQREQTRAGPQEAAWAVLPRSPGPSAPGAVPGFHLLLRACGRTLHPRLVRTTNPPVRESSPAPATVLPLSINLSVSLLSRFTRLPPSSIFLAFDPLTLSPYSPFSFPLAFCLTLSHPLLLFLRSSIYPHSACAYPVHLRPQALATLRATVLSVFEVDHWERRRGSTAVFALEFLARSWPNEAQPILSLDPRLPYPSVPCYTITTGENLDVTTVGSMHF